MNIASVVGARPQFVKLGPVCRAFEALPPDRRPRHQIIHTGQHYDATMSDAFFRDLDLPTPDINLEIGSGSHGSQTGLMLARLEEALLQESPNLVLVYGDTNSTLAAALAATKLHIPVAHVEAGLRSFCKAMPEEINRVLADHVSTLLFCPTDTAVENLRCEGVTGSAEIREASIDTPVVMQVGDVMKDAIAQNIQRAVARPHVATHLGLRGSYAVATIHRAENTDNACRLAEIAKALEEVAVDLPVVLPLHPRTRKALSANDLLRAMPSVHLTDPVSYLDMIQLVSESKLVLTDSGGLQKEAYLLGVPCITLREETEWVELVAAGWNQLAGADRRGIAAAVRRFLASPDRLGAADLYGDGHAAERVVEALSQWFRHDCT